MIDNQTDIYLDNCATTQPYPEVIEKIVEMLIDDFGNPSSLHSKGFKAKDMLEASRQTIADALEVKSEEIFFTSGGTEANNIAILGLASGREPGHIVSSAVEHPSVHKTLRHLAKQDWQIDYISIRGGNLDMETAREIITPDTFLASVMLVNNETGTILPVREIKRIIEEQAPSSILHCDAVQGFGQVQFTADDLGADLISISGHKVHGPKGVGALYVREGTELNRRIFGGDQEKGLRSGTEAMPLIAGFAEAVRITMLRQQRAVLHMSELKEYAFDLIAQAFPDVHINSSMQGAPHIISFSLPGLNNLEAAKYLSDNGICISTAAACKSNHSRGPSVLMKFGLSAEMADSTLRIGLCGDNTKEELDEVVMYLTRYRQGDF